MTFNKDTSIEDLIRILPESVSYMMKKGIKCIACGDPIWGTLNEACKQKGLNEDDILIVINELNLMYRNKKK